jgi:hypothetical protein
MSGLSEEKLKEMEETKLFYYDKYPVVRTLTAPGMEGSVVLACAYE